MNKGELPCRGGRASGFNSSHRASAA